MSGDGVMQACSGKLSSSTPGSRFSQSHRGPQSSTYEFLLFERSVTVSTGHICRLLRTTSLKISQRFTSLLTAAGRKIELGGNALNGANLNAHARSLAAIGATPCGGRRHPDLWLQYRTRRGWAGFSGGACGSDGASVAGASHPVGSGLRGGNWLLDVAVGDVSAVPPFAAPALHAYSGLLLPVPTSSSIQPAHSRAQGRRLRGDLHRNGNGCWWTTVKRLRPGF